MLLKERGTGNTLQTTTSTVGSDGVLNATFTGKLLQEGNAGTLVEGVRFDVEVVQDDRHTLCPIQLAVQKGVLDDDAKNDNYVIRPVDCSLTSTTML